ncbi:MAG: murein biosynthesis integral membrane protein MurJ [Candidatus Wildermuthbacteria bacterium]|nr:murein biosynthesis integral membrane protein MurJ [Candidatus Wildermuthbacteria bacterium]
MFARFFNSKTTTVSGAAILLAASFFVSRILGVVRDRLLAGRFGAGEELDIYFAAFRIPDFIYGILIMGGFTAVFLPIFSQYFEKQKEEAWLLASHLFNALLVGMLFLSVVLFLFMSPLIKLVTPGFTSEMRQAVVPLANLMLLSPILLGISAVFSGVLQYFQRFLAYSLAPLLYNLGIIFGILFLEPLFGIMGLGWGVIVGVLAHLAIQIYPAVQSGFRWNLALRLYHPAMKQLLSLMAPRTLGAAAYHLNLTFVTAVASTLALGSIAIFNFANNLHFFPIALIGVSFGTAVFPALSRDYAQGENGAFIRHFASGLRQVMFFVVPISLFMFLLRSQIVGLLLGTGEFDALAERLTAATLGIFAFGILSQAFVPYFIRAFFALKDTVTSTLIGIASVALNVALVFFFVKVFSYPNPARDAVLRILGLEGTGDIRIIALPLALSLSSLFSFILLGVCLQRKVKEIYPEEIFRSLRNICVGGAFLFFSTFVFLRMSPAFLERTTFWGLLGETVGALLVGGAAYLLCIVLLKSREGVAQS